MPITRTAPGDSAVDQADEFIRENPTHPRVDYAYYIRGLVYFEGGASSLERLFRADIAKRPPHEAEKSFQAFQTLVQQYPKSPYAADARQRMVYLRNRLADYQIAVARYYMKRGAYVGAASRARGVIEIYDGAPAADEALAIMAEAYRRLGVDELATVADNVRKANVAPDLVGGMAAAQTGAARRRRADGRCHVRCDQFRVVRQQRLAFRRPRAGRTLGSHPGPGVVRLDGRRFRGRHDGHDRQQPGLQRGRGLPLHGPLAVRDDLHLRPEGLRRHRRRRNSG